MCVLVKVTYEDIFRKIVENIPSDRAITLAELGKKIGADPRTLKRWALIIAEAQRLPEVRLIVLGNGRYALELLGVKTLEEKILRREL